MANHLATTRTDSAIARTALRHEAIGAGIGVASKPEETVGSQIGKIIFLTCFCTCFCWGCVAGSERKKELMEIERLAKKLKDSENLPVAELRV